ncbi:MAG: hypothetical protein IAE91_04545 [Ignavibacteriaceae bacterium]|nr:hypothetical protein [Ignavibacteriaceae bacterium]
MQRVKKRGEDTLNKYGVEPALAFSVVFPEMVRFSIISDFIEVTALKIFYINFGKEYSDFSVGRFQMKPSFLENLESHINMIENNELADFLKNTGAEGKEQRVNRLIKLDRIESQIKILACFVLIVQKKFESQLAKMSKIEKLRFIATAYNYGFHNSFEYLNKRVNQKIFPNGAKTNKTKYCYADISEYFYSRY